MAPRPVGTLRLRRRAEGRGDAELHFAEALEIHERLRAPYWIARTQLERARLLLTRGRPGDASNVAALLGQVNATAAHYGFGSLTRHASRLR